MRWLRIACVMVGVVVLAAGTMRAEQANDDELVRLQAENKILRSELERRNKEIEALKAETEKLANEVKMLRELCEKAGINMPVEAVEASTAVEEPKPQAPEPPKAGSTPLSLSYVENLIRKTYTPEPGETALRTAQRRKELDEAVIGKRLIFSGLVLEVSTLPGPFKDETLSQVTLQHKSRETVSETPFGRSPVGTLMWDFPKLKVTISIQMEAGKAVKLKKGQAMRVEGRIERFTVEKASAEGSVQFEMGVGIENKASE